MSKDLILTPDDLGSAYKQAIPANPRFFHFMGNLNPLKFQQAQNIVFRQPGKPDYVIKGKAIAG